MSRLVEPEPRILPTPPGMASLWTIRTDGSITGIKTYNSKEEALDVLAEKMKECDPIVHKLCVNYKAEDESYLDVVAIQYMRLKKQPTLGEWIYSWFKKG